MLKLLFKIFIISSCFYRLSVSDLSAACLVTVNTFPYTEDFESGAGNWVSGGVNNDWTLGSPSKALIAAAGSGTKCWITGGLSTSFYQYGERSWVESPCFDFSTLDFPIVSFQIYWETENQYDGGNFQYSLDAGVTWLNVGTINEPTDCYTQNWFNRSSITNLGSLVAVTSGWSGTSLPTAGICLGGNGSNEWKIAKHCLKFLAHEPQVKFRFTFGAGTSCNDYDGLAFDDFKIEEAATSGASFDFSCNSQTEISFSDASSNCPESWSWDFGDGTNSTAQNPVHIFASPAVYQVELITRNSCSAPDTFVHQITAYEMSVSSTYETCTGYGDGTASVYLNPAGNYNYVWNTVPVQTTATAVNLTSGNYTVDVSGADICSNSGTIFVGSSPLIFNASTSAVATSCAGLDNGMAILQTANSALYTFSWNTNPVQTTDTAFNLPAGTYTVTVNGPGICVPAIFTVDVTEGTSGTPVNFLGTDTFTCSGNPIVLYAGNYSSYLWDNGSDSASRVVSVPGIYYAEVITSAGCEGEDSIYVEEKCFDDIIIPNAFTPNGDGLNDIFLAFGIGVKSFYMQVVDRWGEIIFESNSLENGWDGTYANHFVHDGIYVCMVKYSMDGVNTRTKEEMVALIRGR